MFVGSIREYVTVDNLHNTFTGLTESTSYTLAHKAYVTTDEFRMDSNSQSNIHAVVVCS